MNVLFIKHLVLFFHFLDLWFTYVIIHTLQDKGKKNAEELELNYHQFFMKKFGVGKGVVMSSIISFTIMLGLMLIVPDVMVFVALGANGAMAYANYGSWVHIKFKGDKT